MKKLLSLLILSVLLVSLFSCGGKEKAEAYLGLGHEVVHQEGNNGMPMICVFAAAAVIDGKTDAVIAIDVDAYMAMAAISGGAIEGEGMSFDSVAAMGGADFDAMLSELAGTVVGKTASEIEALITAETAEEEAAMLKAIAYAAETAEAPCKKADKPGVALKGSLSTVDADAMQETNGKISVDVDFAAVALDADGKVTAAALDSFKGLAREFDATDALIAPAPAKTKRELGYDYHMKGASSIGLEWFEQAEGFCAYLVGKTADEIGAIGVEGGYPTEDALLSSCTMGIAGYIAVAVAAANAAAAE